MSSGNALITGASGRLGARVLAELGRRGWRTRALVRNRPAEGAAETVRGDLLEPATLVGAAEGVDAVLHLAAVTHARNPSSYRRTNVDGTRNLLDEVRRGGAHGFVHVSTRALAPGSGAYGESKLAAEALVRSAGVPFTILRLAEVYGLGGEGVDEIINRARNGSRIFIAAPGNHELCPVHVDDVVTAIAAALERDHAGETYTLAGDCMTARDLAEQAARAFGRSPRIVAIPQPLLQVACRAARVLPLPLFPDQLARLRSPKDPASPDAAHDLGFRPGSLEARLR